GIRDIVDLLNTAGIWIVFDRDFVFEVSFRFIEGIVIVYILVIRHIGVGFQSSSFRSFGVSFIIVGFQISLEYVIVIFRKRPERDIVIIGGIIFDLFPCVGVERLDRRDIIGKKLPFTIVGQTVVSYILQRPVFGIGVKRPGNIPDPGNHTQVGRVQWST